MEQNAKIIVSPYRWVILLIMWIVAFVGVTSQFQLSALAYEIIPKFNLTSKQFAMVLSAPMLPAVLFSMASGALADRFGVKRVVAVGLSFSVIGLCFRHMATNFLELFILMFLSGIGIALLNANIAKVIGVWFPKEQIGTAMGIYFTGTAVGMTVALATSAMFPTVKSAFITVGIMMIICWILWMVFIKDKPEGSPELPVMPVSQYIGVAAGSRNVWLAGLAMMFFMGANMTFTGFFPNALYEVRGIHPVTAGIMTSVVTLGTILGNVAGPVASERIGVIKPFLIVASLLGAAAMYLVWVNQGTVVWLLLILIGIFLGMIIPMFMSFPMLLPEIGPVYAGTAGGIIATLQLLGAFFIPSFIIAPIAGDNYSVLFALASVSLALTGVVAMLLPEVGSKTKGGSGQSGRDQNLGTHNT